jgi:hypothetical protein
LGELVIFNYDGEKTIFWNPDEDHQIKIAEKKFYDLIEKGFSALILNPGKDEGQPVECFDVSAKKILMFPILSGG